MQVIRRGATTPLGPSTAIATRIPNGEARRVKRAAANAGLPLSAYLRTRLASLVGSPNPTGMVRAIAVELGLSPDAGLEAIKAAFEDLILSLGPDASNAPDPATAETAAPTMASRAALPPPGRRVWRSR
jgi:hypothetical protein